MSSVDKAVRDGVAREFKEIDGIKKKRKHKEHKKHKKRRESRGQDASATIAASNDNTSAVNDDSTVSHNASATMHKQSKKDKMPKEVAHVSSSSKKKRKRDSEATEAASISISKEPSVAGDRDKRATEKKKSKKKSKSTSANVDTDLAALNKLLTPYEQLQIRPQEGLESKLKGEVEDIGNNYKKPKKRKKIADRVSNETKKLSERAMKTPIPLPPPCKISASSAMKPQPQESAKEPAGSPEIIVPETPPSVAVQACGLPIKTPIPFPSLSSFKHSSTATQKFSTPVLISSSPVVEIVPQNSTTPIFAVPQIKRYQSDTSSQPMSGAGSRITQPLFDQPKPRPVPRSSRASSVTSTSSRASSISIPEMFNRIGTSSAQSGAGINPFITPEMKRTIPCETHDESSMNDFNAKFSDLLLTVNFSVEQEYLNQYQDWHTDNDSEYPFPCLGKGSGCTPKKEEILHLCKGEDVTILKSLEINGGDENTLQYAKQRAKQAEDFLGLAVRARIPVPVGRLEGTWTLYCPKYSENHFDRYGYGMRTLKISRIAGFKDANSYVGRLSIPPRSMGYSILTFHVPPHASFRTATIKTATEGYTMDVIFLGNGYLHLRVDLQLLLMGKPAELVGGKKVYMEFAGVHEKAVNWVEKQDEFEEGGRKLFTKFGDVESE
jgi:hypothetical protein